jgi:hypothetical protein
MSHYCDAHGNTVGADEALDSRGNLRSGFGVKVPLTMMDGFQRDVAEYFDSCEEKSDDDNEPRRKRKHDAVTGLFDSRGVYFSPDQRLVDAQRMTEYLSGRDAALRQMWLDGRAAVNAARQEMINDSGSTRRQGDSAPLADIMPRPAVSFADAQRIKREAWGAMRDEAQNAWKERR